MRKLFRSNTDNKLTGLCGGIAEYFGIDSTIVRLLVVITAFFSFGAVVVLYFIGTILVPKAPLGDMSFMNNYNHKHY
ncbi:MULTISPECIES: PspC domain-containing protein [unclassified Paenibacillus]|uniref:PspC domain-containing protein n=1 Tax=unclassified Paenibacillus TaxID=185978 RepID=UPI000E6BCB52|nr:PspC domain-containing protein [Paenibacillus sp. 1011MAR3C5]RJE87714.1 PspC domain-containing protein [Paenibacillus sp. 1011MAR3C5]